MVKSILILTFLGCLSSGTILSMLLLLIMAYITASIWLINQGIIYGGLLYLLVYVGAIVVLIMFVVQLTNTSLSGDNEQESQSLLIIQNSILIVSIVLIILNVVHQLDYNNMLLSLSTLNLTSLGTSDITNCNIFSSLENYIVNSTHGSNLTLLAFSIFNEYGFVLMISIHAIILAIIGPIKLAISDIKS